MMGDPVELVSELLRDAFPSAVVDTGRIQSRSISEPLYFWVQETAGGRSPLPDRLDIATINIVTYAQGSRSVAMGYAQQVTHAIRAAWFDQTTFAQGHILRYEVATKPYVQQLSGIPASTTRVSATYALSTRPPGP